MAFDTVVGPGAPTDRKCHRAPGDDDCSSSSQGHVSATSESIGDDGQRFIGRHGVARDLDPQMHTLAGCL
jgi:hypothetical protein